MRPIQNKLYIGGSFVDSLDGALIDSFNPHDNSFITKVDAGSATDVELALAVP